MTPQAHTPVMLQLENLSVEFGKGDQRVRAVANVSLQIRTGQTLGVVGESGSGKSTLGRAILKLVPLKQGQITFDGQAIQDLSSSAMRPLRRQMQMVFQDPSLNPRQRAGDMLNEVLDTHQLHKGPQRQARIPLPFMGDGQDTANAVLFLASDEARFITGTEIIVDGGMTIRCD